MEEITYDFKVVCFDQDTDEIVYLEFVPIVADNTEDAKDRLDEFVEEFINDNWYWEYDLINVG